MANSDGDARAVPPNRDAPSYQDGDVEHRSRWQRFGGLLLRGYTTAQRGARSVVHRVRRRWRRSLQLRVVSSTFAISTLVTAVLGFFLIQQVLTGLLEAKEDAALNDHKAGLNTALSRMQASGQSAENQQELSGIVQSLATRRGAEVMILPRFGGANGFISGDVEQESVPAQLREKVRESNRTGDQYSRYTEIIRGEEREPALAVGATLSHSYELYYLFPLEHEQQMLDLVQNTVVLVGTLLTLLLAVISYLVTRQVVSPVRSAAGSAEKLASGELSERMTVQGEDDLARLAISFNDMAGNLQEKIRELEELSNVQRQFVSDVSHELRTPLSTIRMAADLLYEDREELDPTMGRSVELLQSQLERFDELLGDLLEISRHDAGAATLSTEPVDIRDSVMRAVGDSEQIAERHGIKVVQRLPAEPCTAEFDSRRINRILRNLIVNAIEHSEGKDVIVTAAGDRDAVAVAVRDFGVGLNEGEEHLVFDRFWRADPARDRTTGGTGLGLSIAKEDAQLHGGWLQAWGMPGKGSQFRLSLPRASGAELRGSPLPLAPLDRGLGRGRTGTTSTATDTDSSRPAGTGDNS
ncbi:two-component system sensor histidine kinase MtrB [Haloactinospora alba]|uniref:Sensor histidine kinase MtrB n=1 Tax=Haloactinospora alba TaxID=405555 RepID=A0A543NF24_9ACTN|nr:MtrAB system histidine kinase MtrB [Haloactinospora alba]TQN30448.1 two-component system sensor histidine kinase MtrB [Haloactinospora alba]